MADEELDEEMEDEAEEESAETETGDTKIELDFSLDPIERLKIEIESTQDLNCKKIGAYLLEQFAKDEPLKNAYRDRKIVLNAVGNFVVECAKKELNGKNGFIDDEVVYGWVLHYVQDEPVKIAEAEKLVLSVEDKEAAKKRAIAKFEADELAKIKAKEQKKAEAEKRKVEKEIKREKDSGQMDLFADFGDDE